MTRQLCAGISRVSHPATRICTVPAGSQAQGLGLCGAEWLRCWVPLACAELGERKLLSQPGGHLQFRGKLYAKITLQSLGSCQGGWGEPAAMSMARFRMVHSCRRQGAEISTGVSTPWLAATSHPPPQLLALGSAPQPPSPLDTPHVPGPGLRSVYAILCCTEGIFVPPSTAAPPPPLQARLVVFCKTHHFSHWTGGKVSPGNCRHSGGGHLISICYIDRAGLWEIFVPKSEESLVAEARVGFAGEMGSILI